MFETRFVLVGIAVAFAVAVFFAVVGIFFHKFCDPLRVEKRLPLQLEKRPPMPKARPGNAMAWMTGQDGTGEWVEVCDFCGGNCGQCGTSVGMGVPPSMDRMVGKLQQNEPR